MDYLLKEDYEEKNVPKEKSVSESGYYVSQEMLEGYLSYSRQNVKQITGGISLFMLSNIFECFIILFCCLLVTTCKLIIESRDKDE